MIANLKRRLLDLFGPAKYAHGGLLENEVILFPASPPGKPWEAPECPPPAPDHHARRPVPNAYIHVDRVLSSRDRERITEAARAGIIEAFGQSSVARSRAIRQTG